MEQDNFVRQVTIEKLIEDAKNWVKDYGNSLFPDGSQFAEEIVRELAKLDE